ncbi:MAG TPA: hypothetical protein DCW46_03205 [Desulfotomaculum sp.]|nr:hypothetical protein [Desulfotomaculum sp.]
MDNIIELISKLQSLVTQELQSTKKPALPTKNYVETAHINRKIKRYHLNACRNVNYHGIF